jgi:hypothetical protein
MSLKKLAVAADELGVKVSSLRTEIKHGRLRPVVIAGKFYLTDEAVREMIEACRAKARGHGSTSGDPEPAATGGSSSTDNPSVALDAANQSLQALKERSRRTSPANTSRAGRPTA